MSPIVTNFAVVIVAAGKSQRFGDPLIKKTFSSIGGKSVWLYSAELFLQRHDVGQVVLVIAPEDEAAFRSQFAANLAVLGIDLALGGSTRGESVRNGLTSVGESFDLVAIHDAARPCVTPALIDRLFHAAVKKRNVIPTVPVTSTLKRSADGKTVSETVDRSGMYQAQTPQVFERQALRDAFAAHDAASITDDSQLMEAAGHRVHMIDGEWTNIKITTQADLRWAQMILKSAGGVRFDAPAGPFGNDSIWR